MDMPIYVVAAAAGVVAGVVLLVFAVSAEAGRPREPTRRDIITSDPIVDERQLLLQQNALDRAFLPAVRALAARTRRLTPVGWLETLEHRLRLAGWRGRNALERVLALKLVLGLAGALLAIFLVASGLSALTTLAAVVAVIGGYQAPDIVLLGRARDRQRLIQTALPDTLDQMTISVEAGLGFDAALRRVGDTGEGPLADELRHTIGEMNLGVARRQAFRNLIERTDIEELRQFSFAVQHADEYGLPIAQVLRVQASELRILRRQRAEERALKMPVKIVFPLLLCIFPTIFIILLAPAVLRIARALF